MTETTLGRWLNERGEKYIPFAKRLGLTWRIRRYLGVPVDSGSDARFHAQEAMVIAAETGIPVETLLLEAIEAAEHPKPPRRYERGRKRAASS